MLSGPASGLRLRPALSNTLAVTLFGSVGGVSFGLLQGWPLWALGVASLVPWLPAFTLDIARIYRRYQWLALFYVLAVTQTIHLLEHVSQMIEIHVLGLSGPDARGIIGTLDVEWVHFVWNTWVFLAVVVLLVRFNGNRWLWLALPLTSWHAIEHAFIVSGYVSTGISGLPGLLSQGGALWGGVPVVRPDLHFIYNLIETVPLLLGFEAQVQRSAARK